jgi:hypothetical protein
LRLDVDLAARMVSVLAKHNGGLRLSSWHCAVTRAEYVSECRFNRALRGLLKLRYVEKSDGKLYRVTTFGSKFLESKAEAGPQTGESA